ncbi:MAG: thioredoxin [Thaumarchaeota archaeon]|jgi:thioredoxin 1|nr:thioredoxin [Candidatus Terraquivivens yellowstonensis]MCL7387637.1 thioredoxin [Candidatus Terraquivivens yellowstonensis]MCL7392699.1 thioredoxin [Candidatus Terraquivivens yellowstonensis]MCL7398329.1 thioredoxin [Candidatus Terraquivivens yellowstonensis]MCL7398859.1 thioredoxin [Candidatus Terraquivivens yellowstonensis]
MQDDELEKIKQRKLAELMKKTSGVGSGSVTHAPSEPVTLTDENFDDFVSSNKLVVVDFWAEWCMPCRMLAPVIEELAKEYAGKIVFGKLNVDENPMTTAKFGIMGIPTLIVFKNGQPVDRIIGAMPKRQIEARLNSYL